MGKHVLRQETCHWLILQLFDSKKSLVQVYKGGPTSSHLKNLPTEVHSAAAALSAFSCTLEVAATLNSFVSKGEVLSVAI